MWKRVESGAVEVEYAIVNLAAGENTMKKKNQIGTVNIINVKRTRERVVAPPIRTRVNKEKDTCKNFLLVCLTEAKLCRNSQLAIIKLFFYARVQVISIIQQLHLVKILI